MPVHALVASGVDADGHCEVLGLQVISTEDGAGRLDFFHDLTAAPCPWAKLVTSDAHRGLTGATSASLPGAAWQRSSGNLGCGGMVPLVHLRRRERTLAA